MFNQGIITFGAGGGGGGGASGSGITSINSATGPSITFAGREGIYINRVSNTIFVGQDLAASGFLVSDNIKAGSGVESIVEVGSDVYINTSGGGGDTTITNNYTSSGVANRAEWFLAEYNHDQNQFDHAYLVRENLNINEVILYGNSPSGTTTLGISSGFPGDGPSPMYSSNPKPNISGVYQVSSGLLPDIVSIPQGALLYVDEDTIHSSASGIRFSIIFNNTLTTNGSGITTINGESGPAFSITGGEGITINGSLNQAEIEANLTGSGFLVSSNIKAGSGVESIVEVGDDVYINTSGGGAGVSDHGALAGLTDDDHPQYILNSDFVSSGFQTAAQLTASGLRSDHLSLGVPNQLDSLSSVASLADTDKLLLEESADTFNKKHITGEDLLSATLFNTQEDLYTSGYVRNADLIGSGYVESLNGLTTDIDIVGSGDIQVWEDGQTIQIGTTAGGGSTSGHERLSFILEGAVPSGGLSGVDGPRYIDVESHITNVSLWSNTPSGNVVVTLSSGAPGEQPISMYTGETEPTVSGNYAVDSGNMPNTRIIPANMLLYCDIESAPYGLTASGMTFEVILARSSS